MSIPTPSDNRREIQQTLDRLKETLEYMALDQLKIKIKGTEPEIVERLKGISEALKHIH